MRPKRRKDGLAYGCYRPGPKWATVSGQGASLRSAHSLTWHPAYSTNLQRQNMGRWNGVTTGAALVRGRSHETATSQMHAGGRIAQEANAPGKRAG